MTSKIEFIARCWTTRKMALTQDKNGVRLPDELWKQAVPDVEFILQTIEQWELLKIASEYYDEEGEE